MIRFHAIANADAAVAYFSKSDGYYDAGDLHTEWGGKAAERLGLSGKPDYEHFKRLIHGLDPHTGEQLTAKLVDNRIPGWDVTASVPKGVTVALERGDTRIQQAIWDAARETMAELEAAATTRIRAGGKQDDRTTGNLVWYAVEHPETRPTKSDNYPDPDRHIHFVVLNVTYDDAAKQWKAVKFRPIMDDRKWFDRRFDSRLASKLTDLGYEVETKYKADEKGGRKYFSWDIEGIPQSTVTKFSRRSAEVEKLAEELGVASAVGKDKLGATSRQFKRKDLTLKDYREYWDSRLTDREKSDIGKAISDAVQGKNPKPEPGAHKAAAWSMEHHFERQAVVPLKQVEITGMERSMGSALPEQVTAAAKAQGLLVRNGKATTKEVLEQEGRIIQFAREGKGTARALRIRPEDSHFMNRQAKDSQLSPEQQALCHHVWGSKDRVVMIEGDAGTGKTHAMKTAIEGIDKPVAVLAPSSDASRNVLRRDFPQADTVAAFLGNREMQNRARGGVIWIDEAGMLSMKNTEQVFAVAKENGARVVLQGDRKQHGSVARGGVMDILDKYAHLPIARLTEIRRQTHKEYREACAAIAKGDILGGHDILDGLGWIKQTPVFDHNKPVVDDYLATLAVGKTALVIAPTHKEGDEITAEIRSRLKEKGALKNEKIFEALTALPWSEAEKGSRDSYSGGEIIQYHRGSGAHRAGERIRGDAWLTSKRPGDPGHYAVFTKHDLKLAVGDVIRITSNGWSEPNREGTRHRLNNGSMYTIKRFTKAGIELDNGWIVKNDFGHITHGYVSTSVGGQGKTVDKIFIAMGSESTPAINTKQWYTSSSRAREQLTIYTNMASPVLRQAIQKRDKETSATELMQPRHRSVYERGYQAVRKYMQKARESYQRLRERAVEVITPHKEPEYGY